MLIGAHVSPAGGPANAIQRGVEKGCDAIQIFNQNPRAWKPTVYSDEQVAALIPLGAISVTFAAGINSSLQLAVEPTMRGRVMALYSVVFLGSTPIGAPLVGWLAEVEGPRSGLVLGAVAALVTGVVARTVYARAAKERGIDRLRFVSAT